jgi:hypothetical protein
MTRRLLLIFTAALLSSAPAMAWEKDLHYAMTRYLAEQAGFSTAAAIVIADADQSLDDLPSLSAIPLMILVQTNGSLQASLLVQRGHFPASAPPPRAAAQRTVSMNSADARALAEVAIADPNADLKRFGEALHPFQDSWSHQGVPDVPLRPFFQRYPDLSFGHPYSRGGWSRHDADLMNLHSAEVSQVRDETFLLLCRFLRSHPAYLQRPSACPAGTRTAESEDRAGSQLSFFGRADRRAGFASLLPIDLFIRIPVIIRGRASVSTSDGEYQTSVNVLASADTKEAKRTWLEAHQMPVEIASTLTVRGMGAPVLVITAGRGEQSAAAPGALVEAAQKFSESWFSGQSPAGAAELVDLEALREQFAGAEGALNQTGETGQKARREWALKFLAMYLVSDHAAVNEAGHSDPSDGPNRFLAAVLRRRSYRDLPTSTGDGDFRFRDRIRAPELTPDTFMTTDGKTYSLVLNFDQLPHDAVVIEWRELADGWRVVGMMGFVD